MLIIAAASLLLVVWGLFTLDWYKVGLGIFIFLACFAVDLYKKRAVLTDDKLAAAHRYLIEVIRIIKASLKATGIDAREEKAIIAQSLFYMGLIDALHQAMQMTESQFIALQKAVFNDLDFSPATSANIFLFHIQQQTDHPGYKAIMAGGNFFRKLSAGDKAVESMLAGKSIAEFVRDPSFPSSHDGL